MDAASKERLHSARLHLPSIVSMGLDEGDMSWNIARQVNMGSYVYATYLVSRDVHCHNNGIPSIPRRTLRDRKADQVIQSPYPGRSQTNGCRRSLILPAEASQWRIDRRDKDGPYRTEAEWCATAFGLDIPAGQSARIAQALWV